MTIREEEGPSGRNGRLDRRHQMEDGRRAPLVIRMPLRDDVEHHRARAEVERDVGAERAARSDHDRAAHPALLDVRVADVRVLETATDPLLIAPQTPLADDAREVGDVRDVVDARAVTTPHLFRSNRCIFCNGCPCPGARSRRQAAVLSQFPRPWVARLGSSNDIGTRTASRERAHDCGSARSLGRSKSQGTGQLQGLRAAD